MRSKLAFVAVLFALAAALCLPAAAQTVTGTLSGRVVDATGAVMPNVSVLAKSEQTGMVREVKTNSEGYYLLTFMPLGTYEVTASFQGFKSIRKTGVEVALNATTSSDFKLPPATVSETVNVAGELPLIETASGDVKTSLSARDVQDFPLPTRNFIHLAEVVPGFQTNAVSGQNNPTLSSGSSVQFNGTGTRGATFQIDGVNNDDSSENQNRQGVNPSTIQQVQVLTNNFTAEFGRSYGAVVLVQSKSGTNSYHGEAYWFHQNSEFTARDWFVPKGTAIPVQRRHQYGFTVGGPVLKNKVFFFGSFDQVKSGGNRTFTRDIFTPQEQAAGPDPSLPAADRAWIRSLMDRFPKVTPNRPDLALPGQPTRTLTVPVRYHYPDWDYTGRGDWNINGNNTLTGRYQWSHQQRAPDDVILGENAFQDNHQQNIGITFTHLYSNSMTGEIRLGYGRRTTKVDIMAGNDTPVVRLRGLGPYSSTIMGNAGAYPIHRIQNDYQAVYNHYWTATSKMTLRGGTDVRFSQLNDLADNFSRGYWQFGTVMDHISSTTGMADAGPYYDILHGRLYNFTRGYGNFQLWNRIKEANFYQQADYKLRPNLTLNFGLREEYVRSPREIHHYVDYGYPSQVALEPRFGFAYSPSWDNFLKVITGGPGQMSIRGGFGLFHGRLFQTYFSQSGASIRMNPPYAATFDTGTLPTYSPTCVLGGSCYASLASPDQNFTFSYGWPTFRTGYTRVDPNLSLPYTEQWNLTVERQLPFSSAISVAYVGNRGIGLPFYDIVNRAEFPIVAPVSPFVTSINRGVLMNCISADLATSSPTAGCISAAQPRTNDRRPDPIYGGIFLIRNGSWSYYNALQVHFTKRVTHGMSLTAAYTWSKAIDTGSETTYTGIDTNAPVTKSGGPASLKALSLFDTPHRFTLQYGYELPWFKNQHVGALDDTSPILGAVLGRVLGGWTLTGTTIFASGNPFTVTAGYDRNADGVGGDRPDLLDASLVQLGGSINNPRINPATGLQYAQGALPPNAFLPVAGYTGTTANQQRNRPFNPDPNFVGTLGRNKFRGDGQNNWDIALAKNFRISEGMKLVARVEAYNAMNHPQFSQPAYMSATSGTNLGKITGQRNNRVDTLTGSRYIQFAFRFVF